MSWVLCPCCHLRMLEADPETPRLCRPCLVHCPGSDQCEVRFMSKHEIRRAYE